jgi:hypothetical protein
MGGRAMNIYPPWTFDAKREEIKAEIRATLQQVAKNSRTITYSALVAELKSQRFHASDPRLVHLLEEISSEEHAAGRGMLSVLVFDEDEDHHARLSFFELAKQLGREISNLYDRAARHRVFTAELTRVHEEHRDR